MTIQFNTDKNIDGGERSKDFFTSQVAQELDLYQSEITRIKVHLSDENGGKGGRNDIRCLLEARLEGKQSIVVSDQADTAELAVTGAIDKLKNALKTILGRSQSY
ncbi:HPF/RaiA family ribosome-associated protein [Lewinella sp. LCG006]|uniref:HPF/RaiA family ribosome-associated protein n=1 Tax=Lewinella sp. LCG006 TaxID=3231911 RepID=UPI003461438B